MDTHRSGEAGATGSKPVGNVRRACKSNKIDDPVTDITEL
ncbi:hypothetical protein MMSP_3621 [Mycobacterium sp. 012931]|nr:hypothetical protein MMSP_3621 [Mycobacterium sp. 012931]